MNKIGVFICHCGTNIAATVDVAKVVETIKKEQENKNRKYGKQKSNL